MKKYRIEYSPGCFDNFEGTQEELDALIKEIEKSIENDTIFEDSIPLRELGERKLLNLLREINDQRTQH